MLMYTGFIYPVDYTSFVSTRWNPVKPSEFTLKKTIREIYRTYWASGIQIRHNINRYTSLDYAIVNF